MKYSSSFFKKSSKILLGTAYFGDNISKEDAFKITDTYFSLGGNHIDTARLYVGGESEKIVGEWIKSRKPDDLFLSTKGAFPTPDAPNVMRLSEAEIRSDMGKSLSALGVDCVDFYWLHRDDEKRDAGEIIETMNRLKKEGKCKFFGASNWRAKRVEEANEYAKAHGLESFRASQVRFSPAIISPSGNADLTLVDMDSYGFSYYAKEGMSVAAYASQAKGFFSKMATLGVDGLNRKSRERYLCDENLRRLEVIKGMSEKYGVSIASIVCASLASLESPDVFPIIGASNPDQVKDSLSGSDITISKEEIASLFAF